MAQCPSQAVPRDWTAWREARGISLRDIADTTKISVRYLEAIERGAFERLPGGVYTEGYIRQYAHAIGDTGNLLWDYYRLSIAPPEPDAPEPQTTPCRLSDLLRAWLRNMLELLGGDLRRPVKLTHPSR